MTAEQYLNVMLALTGGAVTATLHLIFASITLLYGWQRGYIKEGLLHGLLLGPIGLFTMRCLRRNYQATRLILRRLEFIDVAAGTRWYFITIALFLAGIAVLYGMLLYVLFTHAPVPSPVVWFNWAGGFLLLGLLTYFPACPMVRRMPPIGDYEDYPVEPDVAAEIRTAYDTYWRGRRVDMLQRYTALSIYFCVIFGAIGWVCLVADGTANLKPTGYTLIGLAITGIIAGIWFKSRAKIARKYAEVEQFASDLYDPRWHYNIPMVLRRYFLELIREAKAAEREEEAYGLQFQLCRYYLPAAGAISLYYLVMEPAKLPAWIIYTLIGLGILGWAFSFALGRRSFQQTDYVTNLALRHRDVNLVLGHLSLEAEWQQYVEKNADYQELATRPSILERCPNLVVPLNVTASTNAVIIPRFFTLPQLSEAQQFTRSVVGAVFFTCYAFVAVLFIIAMVTEGMKHAWIFLLSFVVTRIFGAIAKGLFSIFQLEPSLDPHWVEYVLPSDK
jgi:hypothetical protein